MSNANVYNYDRRVKLWAIARILAKLSILEKRLSKRTIFVNELYDHFGGEIGG